MIHHYLSSLFLHYFKFPGSRVILQFSVAGTLPLSMWFAPDSVGGVGGRQEDVTMTTTR
jgi:hypothetical protein